MSVDCCDLFSDGATAARCGEQYLAQDTAARRASKAASRLRARTILTANTYFTLPAVCKQAIAN